MKVLLATSFALILSAPALANTELSLEQVERSLKTAAVCEALFAAVNSSVESKAISLAANEIIQAASQGDMAVATGVLIQYDNVKKWTTSNLQSGAISIDDATHMYLGCSEILRGLDQIAVDDNLPSFTERARNAN